MEENNEVYLAKIGHKVGIYIPQFNHKKPSLIKEPIITNKIQLLYALC